MIYSIAETAKANNLKPYEYFEHLLTVIPEHMEDTDRSFLEELLPWSPTLPETFENKIYDRPRKRLKIVKVLAMVRLRIINIKPLQIQCHIGTSKFVNDDWGSPSS